MKKLVISLLGLILLTAVQAFAIADYKLKFGHAGSPNHHYQAIAARFADRVRELTNGGVEITVHPADQLGQQPEMTEGIMLGTHDMGQTSDTILSNWVPEMAIGNLPFIFRDNQDYRRAFDGPPGEKLAKLLEPYGVVVLGCWENGMRHITSGKKPIKTLQDLKEFRIRVPEGELFE